MSYTLHHGDCLDVLRGMADNSVDSIVTDPPYGLSFMGKKWDYDVPSEAIWRECLRVLKPGGHLLAFAGTRTQHRTAVRIEDAGFEIRDMIAWVYGSGFPKSLDVSKAIDKAAGVEREVVGANPNHRASSGVNYEGVYQGGNTGNACVTAPATEAARQWQGWGTALKPALEPITVARKPLIGTVAENVLAHGTGALNIDGCRVGEGGQWKWSTPRGEALQLGGEARMSAQTDAGVQTANAVGRWPANLIHDGSDEVLAAFPDAGGQQGDLKQQDHSVPAGNAFGQYGPKRAAAARIETDKSAARFFYCPKASKSDRGDGNNHPTVKPTELMRYLCRLVTPPGGVVLDPFVGSGSTGKAAMLEDFRFIGIERDEAYLAIANARVGAVVPALTVEDLFA